MRAITLLLLIVTPLAACADELTDYLAARKEHGITGATSYEIIPVARHGSVIEVAGRVTGIATGPRGRTITLSGDGQFAILRGEGLPGWVNVGSDIRVLVKVDAEGRIGVPDLNVLQVISDAQIRAHERRLAEAEAARAEKARLEREKREREKLTSRSAPARQPPAETLKTFQEVLPGYTNYIKSVNKKLSDDEAAEIATHVLKFSYNYGVDPRLVVALIVVESGFNPNSTSYAGAQGLGQLMPGTAQGVGVRNAYDPEQNVQGTVRLLRGHLMKYKDPSADYVDMRVLATALAAYNAGSGAVRKYGGIPPYKETEAYIRKVIGLYNSLCGG